MNLAQSIDQLLTPEAGRIKPDFDAYNVFWVSPESTGTNWYTMAVPYMAFLEYAQNSATVGAAMTGWRQFNPVKRFYAKAIEHSFTTTEIALATTIVIPFTNTPFSEFARTAKEINPLLHIVYHVDFDFTNLPAGHIYEAAFDQTEIRDCINNIAASDKVIVTTAKMATRIIEIMREAGHEYDRDRVGVQLLLYNPELQLSSIAVKESESTETEETTKSDNESLSVVVICGDHQLHDLKHVVKDLIKVKNIAGKGVKFTIFGCNKNRKGFDKIVAGLEYRPAGAVRLVNYWAKLKQLNPDLILIPSDFSQFSETGMDYKRYLDAATIGCPVLAPKLPVFEIIIKDGENGYLYDLSKGTGDESELVKKLILAVSEKQRLKIAGKEASEYAGKHFQPTPEQLQRLLILWG